MLSRLLCFALGHGRQNAITLALRQGGGSEEFLLMALGSCIASLWVLYADRLTLSTCKNPEEASTALDVARGAYGRHKRAILEQWFIVEHLP